MMKTLVWIVNRMLPYSIRLFIADGLVGTRVTGKVFDLWMNEEMERQSQDMKAGRSIRCYGFLPRHNSKVYWADRVIWRIDVMRGRYSVDWIKEAEHRLSLLRNGASEMTFAQHGYGPYRP